MSMLMAASAPGTGDHKDACTSRRTSSSAARRRRVCWWSGMTWPATRMPTVSGGGTIAFVDPIGHRCLDDPLVQEGGTPAIVESIRAGLVVALKQAVDTDLIQSREQRSLARVLERWRRNQPGAAGPGWPGASPCQSAGRAAAGRRRLAEGRSPRLPPPGQGAARRHTQPPVRRAELARPALEALGLSCTCRLLVAAPP